MAWLGLAALLTPVAWVLPTDLSHRQVLSTDPEPPIQNLRMEASSKMLTWDVIGNITRIECFKNSRLSTKARAPYSSCKFRVLPKCEASNYTVHVTAVNGSFSTWIQYPVQEGNPGAAAQRLKCRVHDVDFLTCRWEVGPAAPADIQYHSYLEEERSEKRWECPRYATNELGTHIQCQFSGLSEFPKVQYRLLVHGSSAQSSSVPCSEIITYLSHIEDLSPPNMTVNCNKSHSVLQWEMSSHFYHNFEYELEIQKGTDRPYIQKAFSKTSFVLSSPGAYMVKIRAEVLTYATSRWSAPQRIECDQDEDTALYFWLTPLVIALATLLLGVSALLLCKRYSLKQKLFPPIPDMKDPIGGDNMHNDRMLAWESDGADPEECPVAKVQVLGEK